MLSHNRVKSLSPVFYRRRELLAYSVETSSQLIGVVQNTVQIVLVNEPCDNRPGSASDMAAKAMNVRKLNMRVDAEFDI